MVRTRSINIEEFDYSLPQDRIAQFPLPQRDKSKLLVYKQGKISQSNFSDIPGLLPADSLMIINETKVVRARLHFRKNTGAMIEIFCLEPVEPVKEIQQAFGQASGVVWKCLIGNAKRWKSESLAADTGEGTVIRAEKLSTEKDHYLVRFSWSPPGKSFSMILEEFGKIPLPPYIQREAIANDVVTYQTVYAANDGSVAAPTAGLHFTPAVLESIESRKIAIRNVTLHVGAGTFRPVTSTVLEKHQMHTEQVMISRSVIGDILHRASKPLIVVGTTTTRLLESIYWHGVKILSGLTAGEIMNVHQWDPYDLPEGENISVEQSLSEVLNVLGRKQLDYLKGSTSLLIAPGYRYRIPDIMITNFHQPKSTLLLLIAAFVGDDWRKIYNYALENDFRFLSYGDSCLFFRNQPTVES